jgi:hypothetical protein
MRKIIFALMAFFLLQIAAHAGNADDDAIEVVATGMGKDSDSALKNALRAAVEQVVGTMIDSETLARNDEIITEQILSYSGGFVESHKVIGSPKLQDGLVSVKIAARVREMKLRERLTAAKLSAFSVDGGNLFGEMVTKEQEKEAGALMLKQALQGFPENVLEAKVVGKPEYSADKKKTLIEVDLSINKRKYRIFVNKLKTVLDQLAEKSYRLKVGFRFEQREGLNDSFLKFRFEYHDILNKIDGYYFRIILCTQFDEDKRNGVITVYHVSKDYYFVIAEAIRMPEVSIDILDGNDDVIANDLMPQYFPWHAIGDTFHAKPIFFIPVLQRKYAGNEQSHYNYHSTVFPGSDSVHYTSEISLPADEVKEIQNIVCQVNKTQDTIYSHYRLDQVKKAK